MLQRKKLFAYGLFIALAGAGCNSTSSGVPTPTGGPMDGSYVINGLTCNGTSTPYLTTGAIAKALIVANLTGSFIVTFSDGCVATDGNVFSYPSSTSVTMQKVNRTCSGNACSGSECTAGTTTGPASTFSFTLSGTALTMSRTSDGTDGCSNGQTTVYTGTKQ